MAVNPTTHYPPTSFAGQLGASPHVTAFPPMPTILDAAARQQLLDRLDRLNAIGSLASRIASTREDLIERQPEGFVVVGN